MLLGRIETQEAAERAQTLVQLALVYEEHVGDLKRAFEAVTTACQVAPDNDVAAALAEKLAGATGSWSELVAEASEIATAATDPHVGSQWWGRLGGWYASKLDRVDYALPSLRRAIELDATNRDAHAALADAYRKQQKWADLAEALAAHAAIEDDAGAKRDLLVEIGQLDETQLAAPTKALEAYEAAIELAPSEVAFAALERLYRRDERWADLAKVLDRRADLASGSGARRRDPPRARDAARREARRSRRRDRALRSRGRRK